MCIIVQACRAPKTERPLNNFGWEIGDWGSAKVGFCTSQSEFFISQSQFSSPLVLVLCRVEPCFLVSWISVTILPCSFPQLLNVAEMDYQLIRDRLENEVYPCVFGILHGKASLEVKYAACCVARTLARDADFAARIKKESLFLLRQLRDSSARLRVC